jgi:choline dehydrogenase
MLPVRVTHFALLGLATSAPTSPHLLKRASGVTTSAAAADGQTFDYIVVGGGLTGTTVAARLSEDPNVTVLMIEVGKDNRNDPIVLDVYNYGQFFQSKMNWAWQTEKGAMPG